MTKKAKTPDKPARRYDCDKDAKWGGYINIRMTDTMTDEYTEWVGALQVSVLTVAEEVLNEGMKIGFSYDVENNCVICSFTGRLVAEGQARYSINSRARDMIDSLQLMLWKHFFAARGEYGNYKPADDSGFSWG